MDISAAAAVSWSRGTTRGTDASSDGRWSAAIAIISAVATYGGQTAGMWYQRVQHEKSRTAGEAGLARDDQPAAVEPVREHPAVQAKHHQRQQFHRAKQAGRDGGPGELPGLDEQGDLGGIGAQCGDGAAGVQQPEVA